MDWNEFKLQQLGEERAWMKGPTGIKERKKRANTPDGQMSRYQTKRYDLKFYAA